MTKIQNELTKILIEITKIEKFYFEQNKKKFEKIKNLKKLDNGNES